ncbi:DUF4116 domain-containing protein [Sabulicella glaciei]|uniref:DUF4116 domain-containing protein n=1 Tax=Sabulicella glaciei TaxID=2984948 RepID=A0ABT3P1F2_9PROT|nr:DUF4116 domain-containing protein [Roseococcus sp. MDT2-1-1]MCW8087579.1 DUF4116 domain-containing protein [Roseococcus sp. MDT2-1-1]
MGNFLIPFLSNPSEAVFLAAMQKDRMALQFLSSPSREVAYLAMKQNPEAGRFVPYEKLRVRRQMLIEADERRNAWKNSLAQPARKTTLRTAWSAYAAQGR